MKLAGYNEGSRKRSPHPCPCGNLGNDHPCLCTPSQIHKYRNRISGPLLDRIDIHIEVPAVPYKKLASEHSSETSADIRKRVRAAQQRQIERFTTDKIFSNGQMASCHIRQYCKLPADARNLLDMAMEKLGLSARAYTRILKVSRTIADLEGTDEIKSHHISEAIQYRTLDRVAL